MILQIFGPYGEIGIMRMSEAGNEAAEGGGAPGAASSLRDPPGCGKPQALPGVPEGFSLCSPPLSRGAFSWPHCYPGVWDGHVWPLGLGQRGNGVGSLSLSLGKP